MSRRVLLIAYYVPPAGGPAVQRILQFIQHLSETDWDVEVLTVREGAYPNRDLSLESALSEAVPIHRTRSFDPVALYARLKGGGDDVPAGSLGSSPSSPLEYVARWIRANVFLPDARVGWWPFAVWKGKQLLDDGRFDAVVSSGAPHSVHLIGRSLNRSMGIPWIADLHDPWTDISYYDEFPHTRWAAQFDAGLERSVLSEADAVTTVSPSWAELFASKAKNRYAVVENGFDPEAFKDVAAATSDKFVMAHVGKLYASRNPTALWEAIAELRGEGKIPELRFRLTGSVDPVVRRSIERYDLSSIVEYEDFVPHREAIQRMVGSALLVLVIETWSQADGMITSKLYEYLASGRPVLGVGPSNGDANHLLETHDAGEMVGWTDAVRVKEIIARHYSAWASGSPYQGASWDDIQVHSRSEQAQRLAAELDTVVDSK